MWIIYKNYIPIDPYIMAHKTSKNTSPEDWCKLFIHLRSYIMNWPFPFWNIENFIRWNSDLDTLSKDHLISLLIILLTMLSRLGILGGARLTGLICKGRHWSRFVWVCFAHKHKNIYRNTCIHTSPPIYHCKTAKYT